MVLCCKLLWCEIVKSTVWSNGIVILSPELKSTTGIGHIGKPVFIEALVADLAVEALDVRVLGGFTWGDKVETDAMPVRPLVQRLATEFRALSRC